MHARHLVFAFAAVFAGGLATGCGPKGSVNPSEVASNVGTPRPSLETYNVKKELALKGYDPVSYFPEGGGVPQPGKPELALRYNGVVYTFANKNNLATFQTEPAKFEPAYGGWCAWAMVDGGKVDADPEDYIIQNGRLMVFYRNAVVDTRDKWNKGDTTKLETDADGEWQDLTGETP